MEMMNLFDLLALWTGRFILRAICGSLIVLLVWRLRIAFRRPYYSIKGLLPWKQWSENEWNQTAEKVNKKRFSSNSEEWMERIKMTRHGKHSGVIKDYGKHLWWEPTFRFFWIRG